MELTTTNHRSENSGPGTASPQGGGGSSQPKNKMAFKRKRTKSQLEEEAKEGMNFRKFGHILLYNKLNLSYTVLIFLNQFFYGLTNTLIGAALVDIRFIYNVSIDTVSYVRIALDIGYLIGSLSGFFFKWLNRQIMLAFFTILMAVTNALVPHYGYFYLLLGVLVLNGIGEGGYDVATSVLTFEMWPIGYAIIMQISLFMDGLGMMLAPLLVAPFVYGERNLTEANETLTVDTRIRKLSIPFGIDGSLSIVAPIILIILYFIRPYQLPSRDSTKPKLSNVDHLTVSAIPQRPLKLLLSGLMFATYYSAEQNYFMFSTTMFQYMDIHISATQSEFLTFLLLLTFTAGRLLTAFISIKLQPDTIITYHFVIIFSALLTIALGRYSLLVIQLGTALLGFGFSAMYAAQYAFAAKYLVLTDHVASLFSFLFGILALVIPAVLGQIFEEHPIGLLLMEAISIGASAVLFCVLKRWLI